MTERGRLRNPSLALVERDFSGIRFGACTMTDIDGFMELGGRLFLFVESKFHHAPLPRGQALGLERLVDALHCPAVGRYAVAIIVDQHEKLSLVDYAELPVRCYRWCGQWRRQTPTMTLRDKVLRMEELSRTYKAVA